MDCNCLPLARLRALSQEAHIGRIEPADIWEDRADFRRRDAKPARQCRGVLIDRRRGQKAPLTDLVVAGHGYVRRRPVITAAIDGAAGDSGHLRGSDDRGGGADRGGAPAGIQHGPSSAGRGREAIVAGCFLSSRQDRRRHRARPATRPGRLQFVRRVPVY